MLVVIKIHYWVLCFLSIALVSCSKLDDPSLNNSLSTDYKTFPAPVAATPYNENRQVFFGDLHIHTGLSTDAYIMGVRSEPNDVYLFAKGEVINHGAGYPIQISRPPLLASRSMVVTTKATRLPSGDSLGSPIRCIPTRS